MWNRDESGCIREGDGETVMDHTLEPRCEDGKNDEEDDHQIVDRV